MNNSFQSINGELDPKFNQGLGWFLNSKYFDINIPITVLSVHQEDQDFKFFDYRPGNKLLIHYANEVLGGKFIFVNNLIKEFNIHLNDIILVGSIFEHNKEQTNLGLKLGLNPEQILMIDYYELQTYFFHKILGCDYNKTFNPFPSKKLKYLFGKTYKMARILAMHKLWVNNMLDDSVTGCLIDKNDILELAKLVSKEYNDWYNENVSVDDISRMLEQYQGSPDQVKYRYFTVGDKEKKNIGTTFNKLNHCPSYPYDHKMLFTDTKISLVPETFFYSNQPSFITEKTYKTIYNHHPFTILGTPGILAVLKKRGYKTFDSICNEIYDRCNNDRKRINMVIDATKELLLSNNIEEIDRITRYNFAQLEKNALNTIDDLNETIHKVFRC